jgi:hypothetical protein
VTGKNKGQLPPINWLQGQSDNYMSRFLVEDKSSLVRIPTDNRVNERRKRRSGEKYDNSSITSLALQPCVFKYNFFVIKARDVKGHEI